MADREQPPFPLLSLVIATYLAYHGYRKKSLSPSGSAAAFIIGFLIMAVPLKTFGISLIVFYLLGSRATKIGKDRKASLEEGHMEAGYRDAWQVLSNSFTALLASTAWAIMFTPTESIHGYLDSLSGSHARSVLQILGIPALPFARADWCAADAIITDRWSRRLVFVTLGHFACCLGDTLASELGILSTTPPILITTFKRVPPGTNGALSALGTSASILGGGIMGLTTALILLIENPACRGVKFMTLGTGYGEMVGFVGRLVGYGAFAGLIGSMIDSLLGATVQRTRYAVDSKKILQDHGESPKQGKVKVISGLNVLTNNQVNVVSSILTAILLGYLA